MELELYFLEILRIINLKPSVKGGSKTKFTMKKALLIVAAVIGLGFVANAQDIITLKDGSDMQVLVQEVGEFDIKFKKFDNPNGPNYTLKKSEIFMVRYKNGSKDVFANNTTSATTTPSKVQNQIEEPLKPLSIQGIEIHDSNGVELSESEVRTMMTSVPLALDQYKSGCALRGVGIGFYIPQCIFLGAGCASIIIGAIDGDEDFLVSGLIFCGASVACGIPAIITLSIGNKKIKNSVSTYNRGIRQNPTSATSLKFGITPLGRIGCTLNF